MRIKFLTAMVLIGLLGACESKVNTDGSKTTVSETKSNNQNISSADESVQKDIQAALKKAYPNEDVKVESVSKTPIANLYEVVVFPKQVIYVDAKGEYMLLGNLMDMKNQVNLTEERLSDLNRVDYQTLPFESAIKEVRGNGQYHVAVFSDLDCPFCKRLEQEIEKMTDVTIHTFLMPIDSLHPQARAASKQLWCQPDRTAAWTNWMRKGTPIPAVAECPNPVDDLVALSEKLGFNGTPTIVYPNGKVQSGFLPKEAFEQALRDNQK
ncbi:MULTISPECIES: DsbC family protein [Vitreoscilla]|uniref:Thiol:disulfide interchange protein n=1 Tax=Vitreoscilla stercoraria TaxID=61 RepID=A0ABY4EIN6_VITST|nr:MULTISPECIES: DsbC family protein [Vitreoscilla]AUZ05466.1 putative thiol:disulfide interchange protein [Vitreoscilla sp. C1]UOO93237.1 DsbC family protein [Vitreoscilla stercoraria]